MNTTTPITRATAGKASVLIAIAAIVLFSTFQYLVSRADLGPETWLDNALNRYGQTFVIAIAVAHVAGLVLAIVAVVVEGLTRGWGWVGLLLNGAILALYGFFYYTVYQTALEA